MMSDYHRVFTCACGTRNVGRQLDNDPRYYYLVCYRCSKGRLRYAEGSS